MSSGADLFVVCSQCGSEVSPYITECPYCGARLRRRAPKLPPVNARSGRLRGRARSIFARPGVAGGRARRRTLGEAPSEAPRRRRAVRVRSLGERPYATMALVALGVAAWVAQHAEPEIYLRSAVIGPLHGDWWRLFINEFAYVNGLYAFVAILTIGLFGWLFERRHGPAATLGVFFGAGATGALVATAAYPFPIVSGGNGAALALLAAWAAPELDAARRGSYRDGDLLGAGALAALLLAMPFARPEASWLAGITGGALGLVAGLGMYRLGQVET